MRNVRSNRASRHAEPRFQRGLTGSIDLKHDGYRLIVQRDGARVRLFPGTAVTGANRYPLIVEAALRNRSTSFVIDGEAVLLGVDGVSVSTGLTPGNMTMRSQLYAFDVWRSRVRISESCAAPAQD